MNLNLQGWDTVGAITSPELLFRVVDNQGEVTYQKLIYFLKCQESVWLPCSQKYFTENRGIYLDGETLPENKYLYYYMPTLGEK